MGYWKDVAYDISRGMSKEKAIEINAKLRTNTATPVDIALAEADVKLNTMR